MFKCTKCNREFSNISALRKHESRKTPCEPVLDNEKNSEFKCKYCNRSFKTAYNVRRHYQSCAAYQDKDLIIEHIMKKKAQKNNAHIKYVRKTHVGNNVSSFSGDQNHVTVGSHNTIHNTTNNYYGPVTFNYNNMTDLITKIIDVKGKNPSAAVSIRLQLLDIIKNNDTVELVNTVMNLAHNNNDYPEGKNIYMGSPNGKYREVLITFQGDKWVETGLDQVGITIRGEICEIIKIIYELEVNDSAATKCIDSISDVKEFSTNMSRVMIKKIKTFDLSINNPIGDVVRSRDLKKQVKVIDSEDESGTADDEKYETDADDEKSDNSDNVPKRSKKTKQVKPSHSPKNKQPVHAYQEILDNFNPKDISEDDEDDDEIAIKGNANTMSARDTVEEHVNTIDDKREFEDFNSNENSEEEKPNHSGMPVFTNTELYFLKAVGRKVPDENKKIKKEIKRNK